MHLFSPSVYHVTMTHSCLSHPRDRRPPAGGGEGRDRHLSSGQLVSASGSSGQNHHVLWAELRPLR